MTVVLIHGYARSRTNASGQISVLASIHGASRNSTQNSSSIPVGFTNEDFLEPLQALLPHGALWNRVAGSNLTKLMQALSYSFTYVVRRARDLIDEADPQTTREMITDWERVLGLPDCDQPLTLQGRRNEVLAKLRGFSDPTAANMIADALTAGFTTTINTYSPFVAGSRAGAPITQGDWIYAWGVVTNHSDSEDLLECVLNARSPGHTFVLYLYAFDAWYQQAPDPSVSSVTLYGVAHNGVGLWCTVGSAGNVQTSIDGATWVSQDPAGSYSGTLRGVAHDQSALWCMVGQTGEIQTSADGFTWAAQTAGGGYVGTFYRVAYDGSGLWVAVGSSGEIQTSPDGITWTHRSNDGAFAGAFYGVGYGNGLWVIVGASGEIQTSPDGTTWTAQSADAGYASNFRGVTYGNGVYVAVGDRLINTPEIQTSSDGVVWTTQPGVETTFADLQDVVFAHDHFCAVGRSGQRHTSLDGITWNREYQDDLATDHLWGVGSGLTEKFIAVGNLGMISMTKKGWV